MPSLRIKRVTAAAIGLASAAVYTTLGISETSALATTTSARIVALNSTKPAMIPQTNHSQKERQAPTKQAVIDCLQQTGTGKNVHPLTAEEAQICAPNAPVFPKNNLPSTDPGAIFIITSSDDRATINFHTSTSVRYPNISDLPPAFANCWNDWKNDSVSFFDGVAWGSVSGYGYGNHCGYSDFPNDPNVQVQNPIGSWDDTRGHYDSNYGLSHFNQNYASDWSNIKIPALAIGSTHTVECRLWINPAANIWHTCYM